MRKAIIIGAGPAGLTAAYELLKQDHDIEVTILEATNEIGGISKTVNYKGNRMDMGGHRFFSKISKVNDWWDEILPGQGSPSYDDKKLERPYVVSPNGPDPEITDNVMLLRKRISRIFFEDHFYDYPISLKPETFKNMGLVNTVKVGISYIASVIAKKPETNLENFYINRFGKKLYSMFFEYYTENLWGRHPREIDASWGRQRVKGISITAIIKDIFGKIFKKQREVETSLIEEFKYPKLGPGQLWEITADKIKDMGGTIIPNATVVEITKDSSNHIHSLNYIRNGQKETISGDIFISSMPLKDLVCGMNDVPPAQRKIAEGLPYRDYMTLGVLVSKLDLVNQTKVKTFGNIVPDCWIYVQDRNVKMGRLQIYNNWSPYMVSDIENTVWVGLEYFVNETDDFWNLTEDEFAEFAIQEMITLGFIRNRNVVLDYHMEKVKKAYPAYFDTYDQIDSLIEYLNTIDNLYCVGRNGQHRYNNIDHSMCTSFEVVYNILNGITDKKNIWQVNTEKEYHESK